ISAQEFQNNILRTHPIRQFSSQFHSPYLRHSHVKWLPSYCQCYINSTCSHSEHSHATVCTGMTVRAKQCFSGFCQALHMNRVAYTITWTAMVQAKPPCSTM